MTLEKWRDEIEVGIVSFSVFERMREADTYGAASSVGWVKTVLDRLFTRLSEGHSVTVSTHDGVQSFASPAEFSLLCAAQFPDAFQAYSKESARRKL